jgi:hypothetical protein
MTTQRQPALGGVWVTLDGREAIAAITSQARLKMLTQTTTVLNRIEIATSLAIAPASPSKCAKALW